MSLSKKRHSSYYDSYTTAHSKLSPEYNPALMKLCSHKECHTTIDGIEYMLNGCMKAKLYVPKTSNPPMEKKYTKINIYLTKSQSRLVDSDGKPTYKEYAN